MITWCWLAEHTCIKLVSCFKQILKRNFRNALLLSLILTRSFYLNVKENQHATMRSVWWKRKRIFLTKNVLISSLKTVWVGTAGIAWSTRQNFMDTKLKVNFFVLIGVAFLSITGHLIGIKKQRKFCRYITFSQWKGEFWIQGVIRACLDPCLHLSTIE